MTLTIHKEVDEQRQMMLTVEVPEDQVLVAMKETARRLSKEVRVPGFRRGKVPYGVMVQRLGKETLRAEVVDDMAQGVFLQALTEAEVEPYAQPVLENMEIDPLVMKFVVPLEPEVTLGEDYRELRKEIDEVEVTDEAIEAALKQVQERHAQTESVDRESKLEDLVTISGKGEFTSAAPTDEEEDADEDSAEYTPETIFEEDSIDLLLDPELLFPGTPFVDNLVGVKTGDEKEFSFTFPEDFEQEEFRGRDASFSISVLDVKQRDLPALDDELAKLEGNYETLEELRTELTDGLVQQAENQAREELIEGMIDDLLEDATIVYPPAAVETEIDDMLESFKQQVTRSGWPWEDYVRMQGTDEAGLRENFRENAAERLERRLVLRQLIFEEKLRVEEADIEALIDERVARFGNDELRDGMRDFYRSGTGFDSISSEVLSEKTYERIKQIYAGEAPDLDALEAVEAALDEEE